MLVKSKRNFRFYYLIWENKFKEPFTNVGIFKQWYFRTMVAKVSECINPNILSKENIFGPVS